MKINLKNSFLLLVILFFVAGFLRFYNLNWDLGFYFHPDERNIAMAVSKIRFFDHLNPEFFAYGGFSFYLYRALGELMIHFTNDPSWVTDWGKISLIGRFVSALVSTLTLIPLYFLAKKVFDKKVALLATVFYTFAVSSIQSAHYATTESLFVFWAILLALLSVAITEKVTFKKYLLAGLVLGLAMGTKTTALSLIAFPLTAQLIIIIKHFKNWRYLLVSFLFFGDLLATAFAFFTISSPYTFLAWDKFMESMKYEMGVATGSAPVVYTLQFLHTMPYLYQLANLVWQLGPIYLMGIAGVFLLIFHFLRTRDFKILLLLSFPLIYFLYAGSWYAKFIRYMVPLIPFFIILASYFLVFLTSHFKLLGKLLTAAFIIITILWALAFFSIYLKPQTRILASNWIYQNIPPGAKIYNEHWDDGMPLELPGFDIREYDRELLTIYEPDNTAKLDYYADKLPQGDFIILSSRRLYGTLLYLPEKYPLTQKYYQKLFNGDLGYQIIAEFYSYPSLGSFEINDDLSEESFQVFDHPHILIFQNLKHLSSGQIKEVLK